MPNTQEKDLDLPYVAIIPYRVQIDNTIPDSAKIYFGQLSALSVKFGYCFATDTQLARMKNTSITNIERWNMQLEQAGHIRRETKNVPMRQEDDKIQWIKKRKIFICDAFSGEKSRDSEPPKNEGTIEPPKNEGYNKKHLNKELKEQPEVVIFPDLNLLDLPASVKLKISSSYTEEEVKLAVKRALNWQGRPNDSIAFYSALKKAKEWEDELSLQEQQEENSNFLKTLSHLDNTFLGTYRVSVGNKYIEFYGGFVCQLFHIENKNFIKSVTEYMEFLNNKSV